MSRNLIHKDGKVYQKIKIIDKVFLNEAYQMLESNPLDGIIPLNRYTYNGESFLIYNTEKFLKVHQVIHQFNASERKILSFLKRVNNILISIEDLFLLSKCHFRLTLNDIYFDSYKEKFYLLYLPIITDDDFDEAYFKFIGSFYNGLSKERKNSRLGNEIQRFLRNPSFNFESFKDFIEGYDQPSSKKEVINNATDSKNHTLMKSQSNLDIKENSKKYSLTYLDMMRLLLLEMIILSGAYLMIESLQIIDHFQQGILLIILHLMGLFIIPWLIFDQWMSLSDAYEHLQKLKKDAGKNKSVQKKKEKKIEISMPISSETMIIKEEVSEYIGKAYLEKIGYKIHEKIIISSDSFIVGRDYNQVDYVLSNPKISKRHFQILDIEEELFIKDLKSTNGTYLNNEKLIPNTLYPIYAEDHILIGEFEYTFKIR